jgi:hypothetical protein
MSVNHLHPEQYHHHLLHLLHKERMDLRNMMSHHHLLIQEHFDHLHQLESHMKHLLLLDMHFSNVILHQLHQHHIGYSVFYVWFHHLPQLQQY